MNKEQYIANYSVLLSTYVNTLYRFCTCITILKSSKFINVIKINL